MGCWLERGVISQDVLKGSIAAISVGWLGEQAFLDLDFSEDSRADADFNIVMTSEGNLVEFQGTAEGATLSWDQFEQVRACAVRGIEKLFIECDRLLTIQASKIPGAPCPLGKKSSSLFSLKNRLSQSV